MTETMRAERLNLETKEVTVEDVPIPEPGPGEVLIKVEYCGICHSDISLTNGTLPSSLPVVTQGHEASGTIAGIGAGVSGWDLGDRVIPSAGRPCTKCRNCRRGAYTDCLHMQVMAFNYDGAWAEYCISPAAGLTRIPDNVDFKEAAILADAVATPYGAVVRTAKVRPGEAVGVWGLGGVGTHIVQIARITGAVPIIAVDVDDEVLRRAMKSGADYAFNSKDPDLVEKIHSATGGRDLNVAFDAVGISATFSKAIECLGIGGRLVSVGMSAEKLSVGHGAQFSMKRLTASGHFGYKSEDIATLADLLSFERLDLSRSISGVISLENIKEGIRPLDEHEGSPIRILVRP